MIEISCLILSGLFMLEALTAYARWAGVILSRPESGFALQNAVGFLSRIMVFMFMPIVGYMADINLVEGNELRLAFSVLIIPVSMLVLWASRRALLTLMLHMSNSLINNGSFIKMRFVQLDASEFDLCERKVKGSWNLSKYAFVLLASYIPYYSCWPLVMLLMAEYPEYRGTILSSSSVFNGLSTIIMVLVIDPKLTQISKYPYISSSIYPYTVKLRIFASCIASMLVFMVVFWIYLK